MTAATLFTGGTNGGWTQLSNSANGTPGFASYNYCSGQCSYDMPVYSPPGAPDIVYIGGAMQYGEIGNRSNGRAVQRSDDAGVNFTDMTIDTQGVSRHPDQHAMAATPLNPNILFTADDGGVWRTNGSFTDVSGQCSSRGLSGANLIDCQHWLSKVPTTISSLNRGLGTLQYQSLSVNTQDPLNDIMGGTQDNGTHAFTSKSNGNGNGNANWFVTIFGDGGQSGIDVGQPEHPDAHVFRPQGDINFNGTDPLGWDWMADPLLGLSGEGASFYVPMIADPLLSGTCVHRAPARLAHAGQPRRSGLHGPALQRVLRRLHGGVRQLGTQSGRTSPARSSGLTRTRALLATSWPPSERQTTMARSGQG